MNVINVSKWDGHKPEDIDRLLGIKLNGGPNNVKSLS